MKKFVLLFIVLFYLTQGYAQKNKHIIDSIENVIKTQTDSVLVKSYSELTWQYRFVNKEKAINYGRKGIALAKKINYLEGLGQVYNDLGIIYYDKGAYDTSIQLYNDALLIRKQLNDNLGIAKLYNKIGIVYQRQGLYNDALYNQQNALALFETENNLIGISYSLNNIGILQQNLGRFDEALIYHNQSIAIKEKLKDKAGLLQSYINVGNIYKIKTDYTKAENFYKKAIQFSREIENNEYLANALNNLGSLQVLLNKYYEAKQNILESYQLRTELKDIKGRISCLNNLGSVLIDLKQYDSAKTVLDYAESLAEKSKNTKPELIVVYQTQSKLYEVLDKAQLSLSYYKKYAAYKDSIFNNDLNLKFSELEAKYNTSQKEKQIQEQQATINKNLYDLSKQKLLISQNNLEIAASALALKGQNELILEQRLDSTEQAKKIDDLNKEKQINRLQINTQRLENNKKNILLGVAGIVILLSILLIYSTYRRFKLRKEKLLQEEITRQQEISARNILKAEENERRRIAGDLHDGLGQLMSAAKMNLSAMETEIHFTSEAQKKTYQKALQLVDESCKEIRTVSHSMMPNALLKAGLDSALKEFLLQIDNKIININIYTEGLEKRLDSETETVLYRVIQESVNNVLKHAAATHLDISVIKDIDGIAVMIEDNGKGFDTTQQNNFEGIGLKNIQTRVKYLKGTIEWKSAPNKGTLVAIHIPVEKEVLA